MSGSATPSSSIRAITAIAARAAPMSCCRAPPIPRRTRPTSTPRAASSSAGAPSSRRARRARIGRSCARSPRCSAASCPTIRWRSCASACWPRQPGLRRDRRDRAGGLGRLRQGRPRSIAKPFAYPITDFYRTDPISRASPTMARMRRGPRGRRRRAAEDRHPWLSSLDRLRAADRRSSSPRSWRSSCRCCSRSPI